MTDAAESLTRRQRPNTRTFIDNLLNSQPGITKREVIHKLINDIGINRAYAYASYKKHVGEKDTHKYAKPSTPKSYVTNGQYHQPPTPKPLNENLRETVQKALTDPYWKGYIEGYLDAKKE
jgi:hypothetical protein